ncbi:MAG TPA: diacylglycerol kinase family protein [Solirubrobacteraceae bacterium]|jgi:diacylglycerol kinase family enzyme|nr:diacylglycerol kinase family protein [Solirubrobacteraceae bacterium]
MAATSADPLERLEAALALGTSAPSRRMLIIVNPYATTVSDRLKNLVVYALRGRYEVEAIDTDSRDHATELSREAAREGYDVVVAFGGDGTVNEAANGLAGSDTPLCCLPGGRANVYCRMLGIPTDVVDATEHLLLMADDWHPTRVDVGLVNGRMFLFSAGVGLDASVVERVDAHPHLKARYGEWYYTVTGVTTFTRRYLLHPPRLEAHVKDETIAGVTVIVQNSTPYTYFGDRPVEMAEGATLTSGDLAAVVLDRARPTDVPTILGRALASNLKVSRHHHVHPFSGLDGLRVRSRDERPLPLQVDGDYLGEVEDAVFGVTPRGIAVVS